jgi:hypothetical protein
MGQAFRILGSSWADWDKGYSHGSIHLPLLDLDNKTILWRNHTISDELPVSEWDEDLATAITGRAIRGPRSKTQHQKIRLIDAGRAHR